MDAMESRSAPESTTASGGPVRDVTEGPGGDAPSQQSNPAAVGGQPDAVASPARCRVHRNVPAEQRCDSCRALMCTTCDFQFPGGIHLCPACATANTNEISDKRQSSMRWSIGLAIWSFAALVALTLLSTRFEAESAALSAIGTLYMLFGFLPAIVGFALGCATFDRRLQNPKSLWIGPVSNGVVILIFLLMMIAGFMMD